MRMQSSPKKEIGFLMCFLKDQGTVLTASQIVGAAPSGSRYKKSFKAG